MDSPRTILQILYTKLHNYQPLHLPTHGSNYQLDPSTPSPVTGHPATQPPSQVPPSSPLPPSPPQISFPKGFSPNPPPHLEPSQRIQRRQQRKRQQQDSPPFPLLSLPLDLLQTLHLSFLPLSSQMALRLTCSALWRCLSSPLSSSASPPPPPPPLPLSLSFAASLQPGSLHPDLPHPQNPPPQSEQGLEGELQRLEDGLDGEDASDGLDALDEVQISEQYQTSPDRQGRQAETSGSSGERRGGIDAMEMDDCTRDHIRFSYEEVVGSFSLGSGSTRGRRKGAKNRRVRCALCKSLYPLSLFDFDDDRALTLEGEDWNGDEAGGDGVVRGSRDAERGRGLDDELYPCSGREGRRQWVVDPRNRVCKWHDGHFFRSVRRSSSSSVSSGYRNGKKKIVEGWRMQEACMHCGTVYAWRTRAREEEEVEEGSGGGIGGNAAGSGRYACECGGCESCWRRLVWTYTRVLDGEEQRVKGDAVLRWIF